MLRTGLVALLLMTLASCGFRPMYGSASGQGRELEQTMANIRVEDIRDADGRNSRIGQVIRNNMMSRLRAKGSQASVEYSLNIKFQVEEHGYGFTEDESVTAQSLKLTALYILEDIATGEKVMEDAARALVTFDLVQSDYSNMVARNAALKRLSEEVTTRITTRIGAFFSARQQQQQKEVSAGQ
ncbi:hypothetical protein [Emcibacter nanhaiensis]|uniref:LPS-assembly lipoprotein LptE n=1 Tax=Emcibacter nanhaiensis TaxID=1505037 RepID=A0A501PFJ7_9PROT|nr:hypothetical protein [Emcibacter nanhaiensis]TPD59193.1 hypothetical protein FIV46_13270 [Emcibacter nanhaiensis]